MKSIIRCNAFMVWVLAFSLSVADGVDKGLKGEKRVEVKVERFKLQSLPKVAHVRDRHTLLLVSFDDERSNDADYARYDPIASGGFQSKKVKGKFGRAVAISGTMHAYGPRRYAMGRLIYNALVNVNMARGTIEFWIKSAMGKNIWNDGLERELVHTVLNRSPEYCGRPYFNISLKKTKENRLKFSLGVSSARYMLPIPVRGVSEPNPCQGSVSIEVSHLSPQEWHHVLMGWDTSQGGRLWLCVDGDGVTSNFTRPCGRGKPRPASRLIIGSKLGGEVFDDLKVTNLPIARRINTPKLGDMPLIDQKKLMREEDAVRRWLELMMRLQIGGGWAGAYELRSMRPTGYAPKGAIRNSDELSPGLIGSVFLRAYEIFGDERYLSTAIRVGEMFLKVQHDDGHFDGSFYSTPQGVIPHVTEYAAIEETKQHAPLWFLVHLFAVTGDARYMNAAKKVADFILKVQNENGSWPWGYHLAKKKPFGAYACLNDNAIKWSAEDMLFMYQMTGDVKYLRSFFKCADWVVSAQLPPPTFGWAEQYDENNNPCWGRGFEPPAFCARATEEAISILLTAYDVSAKEKYLRPIRKFLQWAKQVKVLHYYHDVKTGLPIVALEGRIYFFGTPEFEQNKHRFYEWQMDTRLRWCALLRRYAESALKARAKGPCYRSLLFQKWVPRSEFKKVQITRRALASFSYTYTGYKTARDWAETALRNNERTGGIWAVSRDRNGEENFSSYLYKWTSIFLTRILAARIALGEMPLERFPRYDPLKRDGIERFSWVDPKRDWFAVDESILRSVVK